jgi:hypothetical protein
VSLERWRRREALPDISLRVEALRNPGFSNINNAPALIRRYHGFSWVL